MTFILSLTLADRTGELDAKMWDNAADAVETFAQDDFVRVKGLMQVFQNRPQLTLHKIQSVIDADIDVADYFPASKRDRDEMFRELAGLDRIDRESALESFAPSHVSPMKRSPRRIGSRPRRRRFIMPGSGA